MNAERTENQDRTGAGIVPIESLKSARSAGNGPVRCSRCRMMQYPTARNRCRQCWYNGETVQLITAPRGAIRYQPSAISEAVDFAEALRYWRRLRRMTAVQVGIGMGAWGQRTQIRRWEGNLGAPRCESIIVVARALGIPPAWLLAPWPADETSRAILRESSALPAAARQALLERVRTTVIGVESSEKTKNA